MMQTIGFLPACFISAVGTVIVLMASASAQVSSPLFPPQPSDPVTFRSVANEAPQLTTGEALVTNPIKTLQGPAARAYWPASYFFNYTGDDGKLYYCSGTLVGSRTLLTAAHCIPKSETVTLFNQDSPFSATCTANSAFKRDKVGSCLNGANCPEASDIALCFLSNSPVVRRLEVVASPSADQSVGTRTLISGFGCTNQSSPQTGSAVNRQVLTVGWAAIGRVPSQGNPLIQLMSDSDLGVSKPAGAPSANSQLCIGDSGGGTYSAAMNEEYWDQRTIIGINSFYLGNASYVVSLSAAPIRNFMKTWADKRSTDICGVTDGNNSSLCGRSLIK